MSSISSSLGVLLVIVASLSMTVMTEAQDAILPKLPALIPSVPFAKSQAESARDFTPEIRGDSVVAALR